MNRNQFIFKAIAIHGNNYNYSFVEYVNSKIKIICPIHGIFKQTPNDHLRGAGCSKCGFERSSKLRNNIAANSFLEKVTNIHKNIYNYSLVEYQKSDINVKIICRIHDIFEMTPNRHLKGFGCQKCKIDKLFGTTEIFIKKATIVHNDKYDYSFVEYFNAKTKIKISCSNHGIFEQIPNDHLNGAGCPKCNQSRGEKIIATNLQNKNIIYNYKHTFDNFKYIKNLFFDFYLPDLNTCIEYDGRQHYISNNFFGGENELYLIKKETK